MKKFWKILGLGALAAGLTPYKVEKNEETGENSYQALLWRITSAPGSGDNKREININLGEGTLTSMLAGAAGKKEEPHLFSDELSVEYTAPAATGDLAEKVEDAVETAADAAEDLAEKAADGLEEAAEKAADLAEKAADAVKDAID